VPRYFLPETVLEEWSQEQKADLQESRLLISEDQSEVPLVPAVHFFKLVSGIDERKLLSKVKTRDQLQAMSAEQIHDSVILGDAAYEVVPGYLAQVDAEHPKDNAPAPDTELLAAFILDKLT
jgi:hypothetical protein